MVCGIGGQTQNEKDSRMRKANEASDLGIDNALRLVLTQQLRYVRGL